MISVPRATISAALLLLGAACANTGNIGDIQPGERPDISTDEAGFWMVMDRAENQLRNSGRTVQDEALTDYLQEVLCRIAPDYCQDVRIYIVSVPNFNATMAPNGFMQVWTGALLRCQNEAQLAFVLGHELGHYQRRHTLKRWRDTRNKTDVLPFIQVATAMAGVWFVGDIAALATLGSLYAYSRDMEREADAFGFQMAVDAGYDPREAAEIWGYLIRERDAGDAEERSVFFASHPVEEERMETLRHMAEGIGFDSGAVMAGQDRYHSLTASHRERWLRAELRKNTFDQTRVLLDHLIDNGVGRAQLYFFEGELYRKTRRQEDAVKAIESYEKALDVGAAPSGTYRSLGLVYWNMGESDEAAASFEEYLAGNPYAGDKEIIQSYLQELRGES